MAVADCWGNNLAINAYDEYGIPKNSVDGQIRPYGAFAYTGQAWLDAVGMYYYKARIYSPTLGRFLQTDPIGYEDQYNLYAYVGSDPVNRRDPTGLEDVYITRGHIVIYVPIYNDTDRSDKDLIKILTFSTVDSQNNKIDVVPQISMEVSTIAIHTDPTLRDTSLDGSKRSHTDGVGGREIFVAKGASAKTLRHELAHALGATDQYGGNGSWLKRDLPGSADTLMGRGAGDKINRKTADEISRHATTSGRNYIHRCNTNSFGIFCF